MTSKRPYLLRAMFDWIVDNGLSPFIVVNANDEGVEVPREFINEEGRIVLNILPDAVRGLELGNEWLSFSARFSGRHFSVFVPTQSVLAIYAKENGEGISFPEEQSSPPSPPSPDPPPRSKPILRRVK